MQFDENIIRNVVAQVLAEVGPMPRAVATVANAACPAADVTVSSTTPIRP